MAWSIKLSFASTLLFKVSDFPNLNPATLVETRSIAARIGRQVLDEFRKKCRLRRTHDLNRCLSCQRFFQRARRVQDPSVSIPQLYYIQREEAAIRGPALVDSTLARFSIVKKALMAFSLFHLAHQPIVPIQARLGELVYIQAGGIHNIPDVFFGQKRRLNFTTVGSAALFANSQAERGVSLRWLRL
jgi:hypothetical protein